MAAVNFPNNPSVNDTHTSSGSTWKWDGTVWQRLGEAGPQGAQGVQGAAGAAGAQGAAGTGTGTADKIFEGNTNAEVVDTGSDGHFKVTTEGSERIRINSSGQVSIGNNPTVASDAALHIELDGTREYLRLEGDGGTSNAYLEIEAPNNRRKAIIFKSGGTRRGVIGVGDSDEASATSLFFSASSNIAGNSPHMVIDSSGRLLKSGLASLTSTSLNHPIQVAADAEAQNICIIGRASDDIGEISYYEADKSTRLGELQYRRDHLNFRHRVGYMSFCAGGTTEQLRLSTSGNLTVTGSTANLFTSNSYNILELRADENNDGGNDDVIFKFTHDGTFRSEMRYDESSSTLEISTADNRDDFSMDTDGKVTFKKDIATAQDYPNYRPTIDFNFAAEKKLDPRITYFRTGSASYIDEYRLVQSVGANVPRFDHDHDTGECKGLLIEESRTNQIDDSFDLTGSNWVPVNLDRTPFTTETLAPNGKYEATKIILSTASNQHYTNFGGMTKANGAERQCVSFWAKLSSSNYPILKSYITGAGAFTNYSEARFNLSTGAVDGVSGSGGFTNHSVKMTEYPNGWYKCEYEATLNSSETTKRFQLLANNGSSAAGNGTDGYYIWGVQVEVGNYSTSHIPTNGSIATRGADFAFLDGTAGTEFDDIYDPLQGTFVLDWFNDPNGNHNDGYVFTIDDGTGNNRIAAVNSNSYQITVVAGGSSQGTRDLGSINSGANKIAFTYKLNDQATSLNGSDASVDTSSTVPSFTGNKYWWFGLRQGAYDHLGGYISRIMYYPRRLPNSQLKTLSS